jgi:hypothetical protein
MVDRAETNRSVRCNQPGTFSLSAHGQCRESGSIVDGQLLVDVVQMHLYRAIGNIQPVSDPFVRQAFRHQLHDLPFTLRQHRQHILCVAAVSRAAFWRLSGLFVRRHEGKHPAAAGYASQAAHQCLGRCILGHHAICSPRCRGRKFMRFHRSGQQQHACAQSLRRHGSENLQPGKPGYRDVEQRYLRRQIPNGPNAFRAVAATCHNIEIVLLAEDADQTAQKNRIAVCYNDIHAPHGAPAKALRRANI